MTEPELTVHFLPDYTGANPYQARLADSLRERGLSVRVTDGGGRGLPILRVMWRHGVPDVVHVHFFHQFITSSATRFPALVAVLLSLRTLGELAILKLAGVSIVWTAHDLLNHERRTALVELACKHLFLRFLADDVIVHCEAARDLVIDCYRLPDRLAERMAVVPHGTFAGAYPNQLSRAEARDRLDLPRDGFVFAFFGSIRRYKNVPALIEQFAALDADAYLLVAGRPRTPRLERAVGEAAAAVDRVRTTFEFVPDDEVQVYLNAADVVVLPFRTDGTTLLTSGSVLLAMSFGRPVITPAIGCNGAYLADDRGLVYDPADPEGLGRAMAAALEGDLAAVGSRNRRRAARLTWDRVGAATHAVYADGASSGRPGQPRVQTGRRGDR